jgi:hypothetical protein
VARPAGIRTCLAHCQGTQCHHWRSSHTQSGPRRLGVANGSHELPTGSGSNWLMVYVLIYNYPRGVELNSVLSRTGWPRRVAVPWRRRKSCMRAPLQSDGAPWVRQCEKRLFHRSTSGRELFYQPRSWSRLLHRSTSGREIFYQPRSFGHAVMYPMAGLGNNPVQGFAT